MYCNPMEMLVIKDGESVFCAKFKDSSECLSAYLKAIETYSQFGGCLETEVEDCGRTVIIVFKED